MIKNHSAPHIYAYERSFGPPTRTQRHISEYTYMRGPKGRAYVYVYASRVGGPKGR